ncbi:uncharacterized protein CIMG_12726 [Coccidioides immitis RS]|uniref:Uncharacterized protein n=1 Tax=Coccidioides immitis (strain RS) TaxID=246410 RepID=A0A0D8JSF9_COCIM|nr:uncharacterized protein CIMG_12726 [Coccidioides immitis RS]KJF60079.1 hypothetical protein CIMG_12726 [Coccidioides immitis RS]
MPGGQKHGEKHIVRGTYVSFSCAIAFIKRYRPELRELQGDLEHLDSRSETSASSERVLSMSCASSSSSRAICRAAQRTQHALGHISCFFIILRFQPLQSITSSEIFRVQNIEMYRFKGANVAASGNIEKPSFW